MLLEYTRATGALCGARCPWQPRGREATSVTIHPDLGIELREPPRGRLSFDEFLKWCNQEQGTGLSGSTVR